MTTARVLICTECTGLIELEASVQAQERVTTAWCAACGSFVEAVIASPEPSACGHVEGLHAFVLGGRFDRGGN